MRSPLRGLLTLLITVEFVIGNVANGYIVLVNCIDWIKTHKTSSVDHILTALALSRIGLLWVMVTNWYATKFDWFHYAPKAKLTVHMAWIIFDHFSIWLATSLSIFYLLKIANFSSFFFLYFKRRVRGVVVVILLGSLIVLVIQLAATIIEDNLWMNESEGNMTSNVTFEDQIHLAAMVLFTLVNSIPFSMSLLCFVLLIFSLGKHLQKMQLSGKGARDPSTQVHIRALQTVISFLLLLACNFLALMTATWTSNRLQNKYVLMFGEVIFELYSSGHPFILIWANKKLKRPLCGS